MSNPELDNYVDIPLTEQQIEKIIKKLKDSYPPDDMLPLGEIEMFIRKINKEN